MTAPELPPGQRKKEKEYERRWLIHQMDETLLDGRPYRTFTQAYLDGESDTRVRIFEEDGTAEAARKTGHGMHREEERCGLPIGAARFLVEGTPYWLRKQRYIIGPWEVDCMLETLVGIRLLEIEMPDLARLRAIVTLPPWIHDATEVTSTLSNRRLAQLAADLRSGGSIEHRLLAKRLPRIVITGGPCSGKTTLMKEFRAEVTAQGILAESLFHIVPEVASIIIVDVGALPPMEDDLQNRIFQRQVYRAQLSFESVSDQHAMRKGRRALLFDRGTCDGAAYLKGGMAELETLARTTRQHEYARYDKVLMLAPPPPEVWEAQMRNNPARYETSYPQALDLHRRTLAAWTDHPGFHLIDGRDWAEKSAKAHAIVEHCLSGA